MKKIILFGLTAVFLSSCVSQKKYTDLESDYKSTKQELVDTKAGLQECLIEKDRNANQLATLENQVSSLQEDKKHALIRLKT